MHVTVYISQPFSSTYHIGQFLQALENNWLSIPGLNYEARYLLRAERGISSSTPTSISGTFSDWQDSSEVNCVHAVTLKPPKQAL